MAVGKESKACMTENDLYAMGMESPTAWAKMEELCKAFNIPYPPQFKESK
jgi:hypothetical protein